jgi:hypothetical protein
VAPLQVALEDRPARRRTVWQRTDTLTLVTGFMDFEEEVHVTERQETEAVAVAPPVCDGSPCVPLSRGAACPGWDQGTACRLTDGTYEISRPWNTWEFDGAVLQLGAVGSYEAVWFRNLETYGGETVELSTRESPDAGWTVAAVEDLPDAGSGPGAACSVGRFFGPVRLAAPVAAPSELRVRFTRDGGSKVWGAGEVSAGSW